jgi:hypothetical protein
MSLYHISFSFFSIFELHLFFILDATIEIYFILKINFNIFW